MGGSAPSAPTLDTAKSKEITRADYQLKQEFTPKLTAATGDAGRREYAQNIAFALRGLTNPASVIYGEQIGAANKKKAAAQKVLGELEQAKESGGKRWVNGEWIGADKYKTFVDAQKKTIAASNKQIQSFQKRDPVGDLKRTFAPEFAQRDQLLGQMKDAQATTADFNSYQEALRQGIGAGPLGDQLMQSAMDKVASGGKLTAQAERDAVQAARQGMAARGMATGNAGLAAEMLNRDQYSRRRDFENLNFASGVQAQDLNRRTANLGYLGQAAQNMDMERARKMGLSRDAYNFSLSTNPKLMLAGLGSPYANFTPQGISLMGGQNVQPMYSGGSFSGQGGGFNAGGAAMGALGGAATGAMIGSVVPGIGTAVGAIGGGLIGGLGGGLGGGGGGLSDEREKTDIKKIDGPTNVIGIPAYEYRYKGEKKKRRGVMAQDVQKVLPEAVAEIDYKGKKRLAIKPAVIGAALAEHLAADTKPVALAS
jgi:hypothetical protein